MIRVHFEQKEADPSILGAGATILHGAALDDRGKAVLSAFHQASQLVEVTYDVERMELVVGGQAANADASDCILAPYLGPHVILESTTLGFAELFSIVNVLVQTKVPSIDIVYVEPLSYSRVHPGADQFALSEPTRAYQPIPHAVVDLSADELEAGVFFLGFEPERLDRALEEHQMISSMEVKLIFGLPAFRPGWELDAVVPHLPRLERGPLEIGFCAANDPEAAFERLEITRKGLGVGNKMFVAPIGTKPCGIAAAIFASVYPDQVGLLYDHPRRRASRSSGASRWHHFKIGLTYLEP